MQQRAILHPHAKVRRQQRKVSAETECKGWPRLRARPLSTIEGGRVQESADAGKPKGLHSQKMRSADQIRSPHLVHIALHPKWEAGISVRESRIAVDCLITQPRVI